MIDKDTKPDYPFSRTLAANMRKEAEDMKKEASKKKSKKEQNRMLKEGY